MYGIRLAAVAALAVFLASERAEAQVLKAQIIGTITDQSGAVVPGAKIRITDTVTNFTRSGETNDSGNYFFVNLDAGVYRVEAEHAGFSKALRNDIDLQPNTTARVNFELAAGTVAEVVDVSAQATPLLQTDRADNILYGPGIVNLDASLFRNFRVREGMELSLRVESFNFTNTPHFDNPNGNVNSPQFGEINSAAQDQRQFQMGLTLRF
jgi:hypothetical protein